MPPFWGEDGSVCDGPRRILGNPGLDDPAIEEGKP
jgi:hypothetical protein